MRNAFADEITNLARHDARIVLLSGDIGNRLFDRFKEQCPDRFFNCGIAEQSMMSVAAGLALNGFRPVVYTIAPFTTTRCLEQIKLDVCYHHVPVVIAGTGAGLAYSDLGATHHSCEDLAILRAMPNLTLFCPADSVELRAGMALALTLTGPTYLRLGKKGEPVLHDTPPDLRLGRSLEIRRGSDLCLISTGTILSEVLIAADLLTDQGLSVQVENFHTVKPLDTGRLASLMRDYPLLVSVEEHGRIGGLGSAIAEWMSNAPHPGQARLLSLGVDDRFLQDVASQAEARRIFGLDGKAIARQVAARFAALAAAS